MSGFRTPVGYQARVYDELRQVACDFYSPHWHDLPVRVRIAPLLVGSTGSGKTFLVEHLARDLGLPLFYTSVAEWVLICSSNRGAPPPLPLLYRFIDRNERGIVLIDEIEKLGSEDGASDWRKFVQLEIFSALDHRVLAGVLEDDDGRPYALTYDKLSERFSRSMFVTACGAWQNLWNAKNQSIGFTHSEPGSTLPTHSALAATLRLEVLNRCSTPLLLPPLTSGEYRTTFEELRQRLPDAIKAVLPRPSDKQFENAAQQKKGFRFYEELLSGAVRTLRIADEQAMHSPQASGEAVADDPSRSI